MRKTSTDVRTGRRGAPPKLPQLALTQKFTLNPQGFLAIGSQGRRSIHRQETLRKGRLRQPDREGTPLGQLHPYVRKLRFLKLEGAKARLWKLPRAVRDAMHTTSQNVANLSGENPQCCNGFIKNEIQTRVKGWRLLQIPTVGKE